MIFRPLTSIKLNNNNRIKDLQKKTMSIPHSGPQGKRSLTKTTRKKGLNGHQIYPLGGQELFFFFYKIIAVSSWDLFHFKDNRPNFFKK